MRRMCGVVATVVLLASGIGALQTTPTSADEATSLVTYETPQYGERGSDWSESTRSIMREVLRVADSHKDHVLGAHVRDSGQIVVVATGADGLRATQSELRQFGDAIEFEISVLSSNSAQTLGEELWRSSESLMRGIHIWGADSLTGGIFVSFLKEPTASDRELIERFAAKHEVPIRVEVDPNATSGRTLDDRRSDYQNYAAGARYFTGDGPGSGANLVGRCSTGFGYQIGATQYVITEGHCFPRNRDNDWMWIATGSNTSPTKSQYAGRMCCSTWREGVGTIKMGADNQNHGDLALVNVSAEGHGGGTKVWWGGPYATNRIPVIDRRYPVYGDITCLSGSTSGVRCGANIQYKNVAHVYGS